MTSCFFLHYPWTPHLETELELIQDEIDRGNKVLILRCDGALSSCSYNMHHSKLKCMNCKRRIDRALSLLDSAAYKEVYLEKVPKDSHTMQKFPTVSDLMQYTYGNNYAVGKFVASTLVSYLRDHGFSTLKHGKLVSRQIASSQSLIDQFSALCERKEIDKVVLFNGRFSTPYSILEVCQKRDISYYTHERGGQLDKYLLVNNNTPHSREYARKEIQNIWDASTNEKRLAIGAAFFEDRRNKIVQGWVSFTEQQRQNFLAPEVIEAKKQGKKIISIYTSSIDEFFAFDEWRGVNSLDQADFLDKLFSQFQNDSRFFFVVRMHPNLKGLKNLQNREMNRLINKYNNALIVAPEEKIDSYSLMDFSDMVVCFGSTVGAEATYWGKVSVLVDHAFYERLDIAYEVDSLHGLIRLIENIEALNPKAKEKALQYGLWEYERGNHFKHTKIFGLFSARFKGVSTDERSFFALLGKLRNKLRQRFKLIVR
jgi:hypothetical protein